MNPHSIDRNIAYLIRRLIRLTEYHSATLFLTKNFRVRVSCVGSGGKDFRVGIGKPNFNERKYMKKACGSGLSVEGLMYLKRFPVKRK